MNSPVRPLTEVTERAIRALTREIGVADTMRFLHQFGAGYGDYTAEREGLLGHLRLEEVLARAREHGRATAR